MVLYASYIFLQVPISRKSSNERPFGSGEVECRVAAAIGYGPGAVANQSLSGKRPLQILSIICILCMFPIATAGLSTMCKNIGIHHCSLATCVRILLVTELVCLHDGVSRVKHKQVYLSLSLCAKFCTKACHVTAPARIQPLRTVATAPGTSINKSCDGTPGTAETL